MSEFTPAEEEYLRSQRLGRVATVGPSGQPHVVPLRFRYNPELGTIDMGGANMARSKKFRDASRNPRIAFVVDDIPEPRKVRGVEVRGRAEIVMRGGEEISPGMDPEFIRLHPERVVSWGIDTGAFDAVGRSVGEGPAE